MNTQTEIQSIEAKVDLKKSRIKIKNAEIKTLSEEIEELQKSKYESIEWDDLETLLKEKYDGGTEYESNPKIYDSRWGEYTYCAINENGELEIGGYYHNDTHRRGEPVLIHKTRERYR